MTNEKTFMRVDKRLLRKIKGLREHEKESYAHVVDRVISKTSKRKIEEKLKKRFK